MYAPWKPPQPLEVTSCPLPGPQQWPQASRQLTLLHPRAVVTCKRRKYPHEQRAGAPPLCRVAEDKQPPHLLVVPRVLPYTNRSSTGSGSRAALVPEGLFPRDGAHFWGFQVRGCSKAGAQRWLSPALGTNELQSSSCARSKVSSLGRLHSASGFGLLNECGFEVQLGRPCPGGGWGGGRMGTG